MKFDLIIKKANMFKILAENLNQKAFDAKQLVNVIVFEKLFNIFKDWDIVMNIISNDKNISLHKQINELSKEIFELNLTSKKEVLNLFDDKINSILKSTAL